MGKRQRTLTEMDRASRKLQKNAGPSYRKRTRSKKVSTKKIKKKYGTNLKKVNVSPIEKHGVAFNYENSGTLVGPSTLNGLVAIGHVSAPVGYLLRGLAYAITKKVVIKMQKNVTTFQSLNNYTVAGETWDLVYQQQPNGAVTSITYVTSAGAYTWAAAAELLYNRLIVLNAGVELLEVIYNPVATSLAPRVNLDLKQTFATIKVESILNVQNITVPGVNTATDENDDIGEVDAVHLKGSSYAGKGLGCSWNRKTDNFTTDIGLMSDTSGLIIRSSSDTQNMPEIPRPEELFGCTYTKKISMQPGQVAGSKLYDTFTGRLNMLFFKIMSIIRPNAAVVSKYNGVRMGKFMIHALEKLIEVQTQTTPVSVNYIVNYKVQTMVTTNMNPVTTALSVINNVIQ